jgi:hypothetical protein
MSSTSSDADESPVEPPETPLESGRYGHLSLDNGELVIYDREDPEMWVQSDHVVEVGA